MRKFLASLISTGLFVVGCNNEIVDPHENCSGTKMTASTEQFSGESKTSLDAGHSIIWSKGDQIAVFPNSATASAYEVTPASVGTSNGVFTLVGNQNGFNDSDKNVAFYPYMESLECENMGSEYHIKGVNIPESQAYTEDSFSNGAFLMTAFSENSNLNFKNIFGALRLQFIGNLTIKSIRLEGNNGEKLAGNATVTVYTDGKAPTIHMADDASTFMTLDCGKGVKLSTSEVTTFILALPPVSFSKGFTVTLTTTDNKTRTLHASAVNEVLRSSILTMPLRDLRTSKHLRFSESNDIFANPERGFYAARSTGYPLTSSDIAAKRLENITLFYIGYYLPTNASIPESSSKSSTTSLSRIRKEMQMLRDGGAKCILRFAYSDSEDEKPWDATPEWVAKHIEQIKPIVQEYSDVILTFQAGFVGVWGEWYYTENFGFNPQTPEEHAKRKKVTDAMLAALPSDRTVSLRTPMFKRMMYADSYKDTLTIETAYNGSDKARIACFNDCFGASKDDYGTFSSSDTRAYWKADTRYVLMGGETCGVSEYCTCNNSIKDMEDYHWTYLNSDYNLDVIGRWESSGCIDKIKRRLGYRLSLKDIYHSNSAYAGHDFNVSISIKNSGFAAPMNGRGVELILVDENGNKTIYDLSKDVDPRYWFANGTHTFEADVKIPSNASGQCTMYLNLPDPKSTLRDNPKFSIRLANSDIWDSGTGYNKLFDFNILEPGTVPEPDEEPVFGVWDGSASGEDLSISNEFDPWK